MNVYILVEGEKTELQLYPRWISYLVPKLTRTDSFNNVSNLLNSYFLISGFGIPSIYKHVGNAIKDINSVNKYDYLIVSLDSEEIDGDLRRQKLLDYLKKENIVLNQNCKLEIVVHKRCIETWFLGNRKVFKRNPVNQKFIDFSKHYNVEVNDPELMKKLPNYIRTAHFHHDYLRAMFLEYNIRYSKSRPGDVLEKYYLQELMKRVKDEPTHLKEFSRFLDIFNEIKGKM